MTGNGEDRVIMSFKEGQDLERKWSARAKELAADLEADQEVFVSGIDPETGNALRISSIAAKSADLDLVKAAMEHIQHIRSVMGFEAGDPVEFVPDPIMQKAAGRSIVHLYQQHQGIPILDMTRSVRFDAENRILDVVGSNVSVGTDQVTTVPEVRAADAVRIAVERLACPPAHDDEDERQLDGWGQSSHHEDAPIDAKGFEAKAIAAFSLPNRPTTFDKGPFEDAITADLVFTRGASGLQLAWRVGITLPKYLDYVRVLVSAEAPGEILSVNRSADHVAARGRVFVVNPGEADREFVSFPQDIGDLHADARIPLPAGFPLDWVDEDQTFGNNAVGLNANTNEPLTGTVSSGVATFDPAAADGVEQQLLNEFYFCNLMHDFLYLLGFDEAAGNFQISNLGSSGAGNDPVLALAHPQPVQGTANMLTRVDGTPPIMNMGLPETGRHTAFDRDVVTHEFVHGLTNRLVGGRLNELALQGHQSGGSGEGWSDFYALTFHNFSRTKEKTVVGDWFSLRPGGIRAFPYDENYPDGFGDLGTGRFALFRDRFGRLVPPVHDIGEIWCATLMEMNRRIVAAVGDKPRGYQISWAIVTDGLKLSPARPSFIDSRDAILLALNGANESGEISDGEVGPVRRAFWEAFAKFGMGANAASLFGDSVQNPAGIIADNALPVGV